MSSVVQSRKKMGLEDPAVERISSKRQKHGSHAAKAAAVASTKGDRLNIAILLFLYTLQGVPLGLSAAIPIIMQKKHITYKEQAQYSFSTWPFSLKLLWAPIVDSMYWSKFGRRKTWLVPVQYLIAATQDIAVDGWALTMLRKENVGYASTCNSVGQTVGTFLGYVVFITLESATFCNKWLRFTESTEGIITLQGFLYFWGYAFMIATTLVAIFKHEKDESSHPDSLDLNLYQTYRLLGDIMKLPSVKSLSIILLTAKIGFSAVDVVSGLKIIDKGVPKDDIAMIGLLLIPLQIVLPVLIAKYTSGPKPMNVYLKAIPYRLFIGIIIAFVVYFTPNFIDQDGKISMFYYVLVMGSFLLQQLAVYSMFVAVMAFFARVSNPLFGGTNMTLLNTLTNLGTAWANTAALWMTDLLTYKQCSNNANNTCSIDAEISACQTSDGKCEITIDGFYLETALCTIFGILWFKYFSKIIRNLQSKDLRHWHVDAKKHSQL